MKSKINLIIEVCDYFSCPYYSKDDSYSADSPSIGFCSVADGKSVRCYRELNKLNVEDCDLMKKQTKMLRVMASMIDEMKGGGSR